MSKLKWKENQFNTTSAFSKGIHLSEYYDALVPKDTKTGHKFQLSLTFKSKNIYDTPREAQEAAEATLAGMCKKILEDLEDE